MEPDREQVAAVAEALQHAWDEFCADTGCFPDCFEWRGGKLYADFQIGVFARQVTMWLDPLVNLSSLSDDELVGNTGQVVRAEPWVFFIDSGAMYQRPHSPSLAASNFVKLVPVGGEEE